MITDYEKKIHDNIWTKCELDKWYKIQDNRPDRKEFIEAIISFNNYWGCAELSNDFRRFRRIEHFNIFVKKQEEDKFRNAHKNDRKTDTLFDRAYSESNREKQRILWANKKQSQFSNKLI